MAILAAIDSLPVGVVKELALLCHDLGLTRMRELIVTSPAATLLLPFTTALEMELGLETRVAREIDEVARDIRRELAVLRAT